MKLKSIIYKALVVMVSLPIIFSALPSTTASADSFKSVTLGADLTKEQKESMLKYFKVNKSNANILEITSKEEYDALGKVATPTQLGSKAISCSYVEPTTNNGLNIKTNNLTWVTEGMIRNALITAGIENAVVIAAAPFEVSGTAALTGILKAFENSSGGEKIADNKKEAANEEIIVTGDIGEKIGQDDAANLINDVKKEVIKSQPDTEKELDKIIEKNINNYSNKLSKEDISSIKSLMTKINNLDLNYNSIKDQLNSVTETLKDKLDSEEAKGFFSKIGDFLSTIFDAISDFFSQIFS